MRKKYIKPEFKVIELEVSDIIATSGMVNGDVTGSANYTTQGVGMVGGTIGGAVFNNDWISDSFNEQ